MNEQIQKFAEQADLFADSKLQMKGEYHPDWHDIRDEKFAELIVRTCIAKCDDLNSMKYIAQHFGIKVQGLTDE
jgi:hypothetical protein